MGIKTFFPDLGMGLGDGQANSQPLGLGIGMKTVFPIQLGK